MAEPAGKERNENGAVRTTSIVSLILCAVSMALKIVTAVLGGTSIQIIDCARSVVETGAVFIWWVICSGKMAAFESRRKREQLDRMIHICVIVSGVLMAVFACFRYYQGVTHSGKLLPGILISAVGMIDNGIIAVLYAKNKHADPEVITQKRLFTVKSCADACVAGTLTTMMIAPGFSGLGMAELISSVLVSAMMIAAGRMKKNVRQFASIT